MDKYIGRGRGISTNVPELELIKQVRLRPLLYDKNVKDYRKPGISDIAWQSVADALNTSVSNCKKRWKSLRDTFIKYYRIEMLQKSDSNRKRKQWIFFQELSFLMPHVELYRLDESKLDEQANDSVSNYLKEDYLDEKQYFFTADEEDNSEQVTYQIKINDEYEENVTEENYEEEERLDDGAIIDMEEANQIMVNKVIEKLDDGHTTYMVLEDNNDQNIENTTAQNSIQISTSRSLSEQSNPAITPSQQQFQPSTSSTNSNYSPSRNVVDPDERYLLSCLPAFKRFTPQQKAYVRMGIEKLFYEVEFEKFDEPKHKRRRDS